MIRTLIPISAAIISFLGSIFLLIAIQEWGVNEERVHEYHTLNKMPYSEPAARMHQAFESGRIFFTLRDKQFSWHPANFDPGLLSVQAFKESLIPPSLIEIHWNNKLFESFALVRDRMLRTFETGEIFSSLDDSLFAWKTFFLLEDDDEE